MRRNSGRDRGGFSLIEVIVALVVSAIVVAGARTVVDGLADAARSVVARARETDRTANGAAQLRALARRVEVGTAPARTFDGAPGLASFSSWCDTAQGWQARCRVTMVVDATADGDLLRLVVEGIDEPIIVDTGARRLIYLEDANGGGRWFSAWGVGLTAPLAVGVVRAEDTLVIRLGGRG